VAGGGAAVTVRPTVVVCVAVEPVPVTVIVYVPGAVDAPALTVIVDEPPPVSDEGLNPTVVPAGWPLAVSVTVWAEPEVTVVAMAELPAAPGATVTLPGEAPSEKSETGAGVTVRLMDVEWVALEPAPVIVIVYVPGDVIAPALTVIVDDPPAVTDDGPKLTVVPAGWPAALNTTVWAAPEVTAVETVDVPPEPCTTESPVGLAPTEKSGCVTVSVTVVVCVAVEPVPVTVIVYVPGDVDAPTSSVIVEEPPAVTEEGLKPTVVPAGWPLAASDTFWAVPMVTAVAIVVLPPALCATVRMSGLEPRVKSGCGCAAVTVSDTVVVCSMAGPVPVTVTV
jgi:hypothetical protein